MHWILLCALYLQRQAWFLYALNRAILHNISEAVLLLTLIKQSELGISWIRPKQKIGYYMKILTANWLEDYVLGKKIQGTITPSHCQVVSRPWALWGQRKMSNPWVDPGSSSFTYRFWGNGVVRISRDLFILVLKSPPSLCFEGSKWCRSQWQNRRLQVRRRFHPYKSSVIVCVHVCLHMHVCACLCICLWVSMYIYMYVSTCVYLSVCLCVCLCLCERWGSQGVAFCYLTFH